MSPTALVNPQIDPLVSEIASLVAEGKCLLFLGAGVHSSPPDDCPYTYQGQPYVYPRQERPPLGNELSEELARESGFLAEYPRSDPKHLQRVSQYYEAVYRNRNILVQKLREEIELNKRPSPILRAFASMNFPIVCTTNYDQLLEMAFFAAQKIPQVSVYSKERKVATDYQYLDLNAERPFLFKVHGDIATPESIVITDEDYIDFIMRMTDVSLWNPVPPTIQYHFRKLPTLFIGYSLADYNLRLLFKTLRWIGDQAHIPPSYSVDLYPDGIIRKIYSERKQLLHYVVLDVWSFVPQLYSILNDGEEMPL